LQKKVITMRSVTGYRSIKEFPSRCSDGA
jgi:hypothetical protein